MPSWYKSTIKYQKEDNSGSLKTITESYLIDAISFTEAEARSYEQIVTGASDFGVPAITRMPLADLFSYEDGERWFKAKVVYFSVCEKSGKEKKVVNQMLVNADNIDQALQRITESLRSMLVPYETESIILTNILDVFPYVEKSEEIPSNLRPISEVLSERQQDKKRDVFTQDPNTPYKVGAIWASQEGMMMCKTGREEDEEFDSQDWELMPVGKEVVDHE